MTNLSKPDLLLLLTPRALVCECFTRRKRKKRIFDQLEFPMMTTIEEEAEEAEEERTWREDFRVPVRTARPIPNGIVANLERVGSFRRRSPVDCR